MTGSASPSQDDVARFVERFALMMTEAGLPRMPARVFGVLLVADTGKRTASELAESLQVSPAAVSGAVRYLGQVGLVRRVRDPGERRDHYELLDDLWYEMYTNRDKQFAEWVTIMSDGAATLGVHTPVGARLATSAQFFEFLRGEIPKLLAHWRDYQKERGLIPPTG